jgi:hypothetical protein
LIPLIKANLEKSRGPAVIMAGFPVILRKGKAKGPTSAIETRRTGSLAAKEVILEVRVLTLEFFTQGFFLCETERLCHKCLGYNIFLDSNERRNIIDVKGNAVFLTGVF